MVSQAFAHRFEVFYWRERDDEVDVILRKKGSVIAIEVKSNAEKKTAGLEKFKQLFQPKKAFIVGDGGLYLMSECDTDTELHSPTRIQIIQILVC